MIVRGSKSYGKDGRLYIVAEEIRFPASSQAASFREPNGTPLWKGSDVPSGEGPGDSVLLRAEKAGLAVVSAAEAVGADKLVL